MGIQASKLLFNRTTTNEANVNPPTIDVENAESRLSQTMPLNRIEINLHQRYITPSEEIPTDDDREIESHSNDHQRFGALAATSPNLANRPPIKPIRSDSVDRRHPFSRTHNPLETSDQIKRNGAFSLKPSGFFIRKSKSYMRSTRAKTRFFATNPSAIKNDSYLNVETQISQHNELSNPSFSHSENDLIGAEPNDDDQHYVYHSYDGDDEAAHVKFAGYQIV
jgi:hypothetical protein